jgi:hypothetical protein
VLQPALSKGVDQVNWSLPNDLVGDVDVAASRVPGFDLHDDALIAALAVGAGAGQVLRPPPRTQSIPCLEEMLDALEDAEKYSAAAVEIVSNLVDGRASTDATSMYIVHSRSASSFTVASIISDSASGATLLHCARRVS